MWHDSLTRWYVVVKRALPLIHVQPYVTWLIHVRHASYIPDKTHSEGGMWISTGSLHSFMCIHMRHDSSICDMNQYQGGMRFSVGSFHSFMCNHTWHDSFTCDMNYSYATWIMQRVGCGCQEVASTLCAVRSTRASTLGYVPSVSQVNDLQFTTQAQSIIFRQLTCGCRPHPIYSMSACCSMLQCVAVCCTVL